MGRSTLEVARRHANRFEVVGVSAHRSVGALRRIADEFSPSRVVVADRAALASHPDPVRDGWRSGPEAMAELAACEEAEIVVNAVVGAAGLPPTIAALEAGKRCALANKESLVAAGPLVLAAAGRGGGELVPVDSEHSALLQCMAGSRRNEVARLILTASGGPFRKADAESLRGVTAEMALRHPTWEMGAKISIDSATLANKALEVIEAHVLYGVPYDRIDVVVHPGSIVHSLVEFVDGSVLAQLSEPSMELPILHALAWPDRPPDRTLRTFDPLRSSPLVFEPLDRERFPLFAIGVEAGRAGGCAPAVFNAANEVAVSAFLRGMVSFTGMATVVDAVLSRLSGRYGTETLAEVLEVDREARRRARAEVRRKARPLPKGDAWRRHNKNGNDAIT